MTRGYRILTTVTSSQTAAQPPEAIVNVESDFVVILAALLCALICIVGLIAVARCACLRRGNIGATGGGRSSNQPSAANKGLEKKFVEAIPKHTHDGKLGGDCSICLMEYVTGDEIRVLPQCGHRFHVGCIDLWLRSHSSCPSCRQILVATRCKKCGEFPSCPAGEVKVEVGVGKERRQDSSTTEYLP